MLLMCFSLIIMYSILVYGHVFFWSAGFGNLKKRDFLCCSSNPVYDFHSCLNSKRFKFFNAEIGISISFSGAEQFMTKVSNKNDWKKRSFL